MPGNFAADELAQRDGRASPGAELDARRRSRARCRATLAGASSSWRCARWACAPTRPLADRGDQHASSESTSGELEGSDSTLEREPRGLRLLAARPCSCGSLRVPQPGRARKRAACARPPPSRRRPRRPRRWRRRASVFAVERKRRFSSRCLSGGPDALLLLLDVRHLERTPALRAAAIVAERSGLSSPDEPLMGHPEPTTRRQS